MARPRPLFSVRKFVMILLGNWPDFVRVSAGTLAILFLIVPIAAAQDDFEEESPYAPGLVATMQGTGDDGAAKPIVRIDEALAFDWDAASPDPRLPAGDFSAAWRGRLWTQVPGRYELAVYASGGTVSLRLAGNEVLRGDAAAAGWIRTEPIELEFGRHEFEVMFNRTAVPASLTLYWTGPNFVLEPVPARFLMHDREATPSSDFERGRTLAAALRCVACHGDEADRGTLAAPALENLSGNVHSAWLVDWLVSKPADGTSGKLVRRMPHFALSEAEAADVAAWLTSLPAGKPLESPRAIDGQPGQKKKGGKAKSAPPKPSAAEGERLFLTLGCLACHQHGELGESGLFGGGDLTAIAAKRSPEFFARWLADPASLNRQHRMPVFDLSPVERDSLALWLSQQGMPAQLEQPGNAARGERIVAQQRCAACHALPGVGEAAKVSRLKPLSAASEWQRACASTDEPAAGQPRYRLAAADAEALAAYYSAINSAILDAKLARPDGSPQAAGRDLLVELNCLACHAREGIDRQVHALPGGLEKNLAAVVAQHDALGKQVPAMTPPALNAVGDKLTDEALAAAIRREGKVHRPYLMARMPKFRLTDEQLASLVAYFTATDRIPERPEAEDSSRPLVAAMLAAGPRLVTTDGFGCTSCHQVGSVLPDKAPLNARGPDLSMLDKRIRREWFGRWCASPARIVPRMEMPSVQVPVRGVLGDKIDDQLAAVWHILNTPGFEPPEPNPVRVLRLSGVPEKKESPLVLHDVIKVGDRTHLFPLVIGLPNRHNILYDLETGRLAAWWLGDMARQRTKGKSWFWEAGGTPILETSADEDELRLIVDGVELRPVKSGQFSMHIARIEQSGFKVRADQWAEFAPVDGAGVQDTRRIEFAQSWTSDIENLPDNTSSFTRTLEFDQRSLSSFQVKLRLVPTHLVPQCRWNEKTRELVIGDSGMRIRLGMLPKATWSGDGTLTIGGTAEFVYTSPVPSDQQLASGIPQVASEARELSLAPGFNAVRLPLPDDIMPSALGFRESGRLTFGTLKGQVYFAHDANADGDFDALHLVADGLPTPYGIYVHRQSPDRRRPDDNLPIDVLTKDGLWKLFPGRESSTSPRRDLVASGWGMTDDYHDWAVGLVAGNKREYYIALPCQQDQRSEAAAKHRGQVLKLVPRRPTPYNPAMPDVFKLEVVSSGHRFPMGLARNSGGELFVTDNQGDYNPFNELNHVRPGAHFGFINALEKEKGFKPPRFDKPAVDIPHPWTRSVNGICFLETPREMLDRIPPAERANHGFGPLEGHLVGCEYDTRALIRMTLQKVGDTYQGAAYPLSIPPDNVEDGLLGPIVCAVSPKGELYVGNIRDSGWGAGNNVGDIVRIKIEPEKLPCGIAEVRATSDGFTIDFFRPVDRTKALDAANYSIASYRRESTPAYGGPNLDRRSEKIKSLELSEDGKRVIIKFDDLRAGFLYEFQLKPLTRGKELFHPAEAHYTLNQIP